MKLIRKFFVIVAVVAAVQIPVAAQAGPISSTCNAVEAELSKYGWHEPVCAVSDPFDS